MIGLNLIPMKDMKETSFFYNFMVQKNCGDKIFSFF